MELKRTPLHDLCQEAGGRMVPFAGWEMAVQYSGLVAEHTAVRQAVGMFDISHMGVLRFSGPNPKDALQQLVPTDLHRIGPGQASYTVLLNHNGGILDDLIVYDLDDSTVLAVINAACAETDRAWLEQQLRSSSISISDAKGDGVLLALQGPEAQAVLEELSSTSLQDLPRFGHRLLALPGLNAEVLVARTGYTGEDGFELLLPRDAGRELWKHLLKQGVTPCGLGARDSLRLEAAMHLYGQDMDVSTTPLEAGLGWLVHLENPVAFIGRDALEREVASGSQRRLVGLRLEGRAIPRHDYPILNGDQVVGKVSSGGWAPSLEAGIGLGYVPTALATVGTPLSVEIRGKRHPATVVKRPFYRRTT
ncbi:glycine cleavage system aminomethyltransferase GcvT [Synechococcus sp. HK01-R]|uniref:glycine cleavage system aminomethyltransferase GcvT n=1 Tax=Synechococcus sp. HK01-R TaxID=2751171 RepID=UPI0016244195|nr:glycine cleavage system aminomethyltransferase GcvT [Synechococcus sp. HK01-R]QNG27608.1 glycine cleavage system aminomethyltransferase GcvT [Synechococcus sp. HK01-R]